MQLVHNAIDLFVHLDTTLGTLVAALGVWFYGLLFVIIFAETGLVVTPFLPGDSLLFAVGALAALEGSPLDLPLLALTCYVAALCGDLTNYSIGHFFGPRIFRGETSRLLNRKHLTETEAFYTRHGGKTVILARFIPIIRTFAPFVAGVGSMSFRRFFSFSVLGAGLWIIPFLSGGYWLGNSPVIKTNFHLVIVAIIAISLVPPALQVLKARRAARLTPTA